MANSIVVDWLNENSFRGYPLKDNSPRLIGATGRTLDAIILDANLVYKSTAMPDEVRLTDLTIDLSNATFAIQDQTFVCSLAGPFPAYVRNSEGSLLVIGSSVQSLPVSHYEFSSTIFEPSVSSEFIGSLKGVSSLNFNSIVKSGDLTFKDGFQFLVTTLGQTIGLAAANNAGDPIDCSSFFVIPNNQNCNSIISSINGIEVANSPDVFHIVAGDNIAVYEDIPNHRIYIGLKFAKEDVCKSPLANPIGNAL